MEKGRFKVLTQPVRGWKRLKGKMIELQDMKFGDIIKATVRLKEVRCGKSNCSKCPHKIYAYAQFRQGKKVTEKYLGVAR